MRITNIILAVGLLFGAVFTSGCGQVVPPGTTVVLVKPSGKSQIFEKGAFKAWGRTKAYFIDSKLKSYDKTINILCADDINMTVSVKWIGSFKVSEKTIETIKKKVPSEFVDTGDIRGYQLSLDKFFDTTMKDIVSSTARKVISPYKTDAIRPARDKIAEEIRASVVTQLTELGYPVETSNVLLTNLDYPDSIDQMRRDIKQAQLEDLRKAAVAKANVAAAKRDAELAAEVGKATLVEATAKAEANRVISASLTPAILKQRELDALTSLASGPNNTVIIMPYDSLGTGLEESLLMKDAINDNTSAIRASKK